MKFGAVFSTLIVLFVWRFFAAAYNALGYSFLSGKRVFRVYTKSLEKLDRFKSNSIECDFCLECVQWRPEIEAHKANGQCTPWLPVTTQNMNEVLSYKLLACARIYAFFLKVFTLDLYTRCYNFTR